MPKKTTKKVATKKTTASKAASKSTKKTSSRKKASKKTVNKETLSKFARFRQGLIWRNTMYVMTRVCIVLFIALLGLTAYLDITIRKQFEGKKWALPAHVYTRPMELYVGQLLDRAVVKDELNELGYTSREKVNRVGSYNLSADELVIFQRDFRFWDESRPQQITRIGLSGDQITSITVDPWSNGESLEQLEHLQS